MPNESLISALEQLHDAYIQRQKATNSLMTALKGTNSAIVKASRSLKEYADQYVNTNGAGLTEAQASFAEGAPAQRLKNEVVDPLMPELRRESKATTGLATALRDALVALRGEAVDVVRLGHAYQSLQAGVLKTKVQDDMLAALLPELEQELQHAQRTLGETFGQALRDAVAELGIEIGGRPPRFELGRFEVNADFVSRTASISYGKELVTKRVPLSVDAVVKAYRRDAKAIMGRNEDGGRWMEQFYVAWQNAQRKRDLPVRPEGVRVNIVDCYFELVLLRQSRSFRIAPGKGSFVDYTRAQFAYDFFEFADRQRRDYRGLRVAAHSSTKSQTDSADKSIWIVEGDSPYAGRYLTDIVFSKGD